MKTIARHLFLPALAATLLLGTVCARAGGGIQDSGAFFSEFAKVNANGVINEVSTKLHKDIAVQTFAAVPEELKSTVLVADKAASNRGFSKWAEQLARSTGVNGVMILLVKQPAHLQVVVGTDTQKQAFTLLDRETLVQKMLTQLRSKKNDDALIDAVNFISTTMRSHRSSSSSAAPFSSKAHSTQSQGISSWLPTIGIVLLIWVGFSVIRGLFRSMSGGGSGGGYGQPGYNGGVGGGGFMQNMMGSMFGAAAGMWMYDNFFGSHSSAASPGFDQQNSLGNDSSAGGGYSGTDTDYSSSGGSFGGDSGGGGFDSGGGGGFDGGGGGDFGGGGGDF